MPRLEHLFYPAVHKGPHGDMGSSGVLLCMGLTVLPFALSHMVALPAVASHGIVPGPCAALAVLRGAAAWLQLRAMRSARIFSFSHALRCERRAAHGTVGSDGTLQPHVDAEAMSGTINIANGAALSSTSASNTDQITEVPLPAQPLPELWAA
jgi:hypothetical protein